MKELESVLFNRINYKGYQIRILSTESTPDFNTVFIHARDLLVACGYHIKVNIKGVFNSQFKGFPDVVHLIKGEKGLKPNFYLSLQVLQENKSYSMSPAILNFIENPVFKDQIKFIELFTEGSQIVLEDVEEEGLDEATVDEEEAVVAVEESMTEQEYPMVDPVLEANNKLRMRNEELVQKLNALYEEHEAEKAGLQEIIYKLTKEVEHFKIELQNTPAPTEPINPISIHSLIDLMHQEKVKITISPV